MSYWIKFEDGEEGCLGTGNIPQEIFEACARSRAAGVPRYLTTDDAKTAAESLRGKLVVGVFVLPYNASPMLQSYPGCEPWCYTPHECKGRSSCPKRRACSE